MLQIIAAETVLWSFICTSNYSS